MARGTDPALGMSIGATNLAAVISGHAVTRKPVLTLFGHRPPQVGLPSENPPLDEYGLVITDFVDRVGDPVAIAAADGSEHPAESLLGDALRALAYAASGGRALPQSVGVTYPAHWSLAAVDALFAGLSRVPDWSSGSQQVSVIADAEAALLALLANPGLPTSGVVVVCDFGGSGSSITVVDAANGFQPVATTVRHADFAGDRIDQALLDHVLDDLPSAGSLDSSTTSAISALARLRAECRTAKEQLSSSTATTLAIALPELSDDIRLTRPELEEVIRPSLDGFLVVVQETLQRNEIREADLTAVVSVGGGANIPAITTALSERLGVPVITAPRPHLTAAIGAALKSGGGPVESDATALAPAVPEQGSDATALAPVVAERPADATTMLPDAGSGATPALAWSEEDDDGDDIVPFTGGEYPSPASDYPEPADDAGPPSGRRRFDHDDARWDAAPDAVVWYRRPLVTILATALVVLALAAAITILLLRTPSGAPTTSAPSVSPIPAPETPAPATESSPPQPIPPPTQTTQAPYSPPPTWTPSPTTQAPPVVTTTQQPTTTQPPATTPWPPPRRFPRIFPPRILPPP